MSRRFDPLPHFRMIAEGACWACAGRLTVRDGWGVCDPCQRAFQVRGDVCVELLGVSPYDGWITSAPTLSDDDPERHLLPHSARVFRSEIRYDQAHR